MGSTGTAGREGALGWRALATAETPSSMANDALPNNERTFIAAFLRVVRTDS
jgi:hypothetical protein